MKGYPISERPTTTTRVNDSIDSFFRRYSNLAYSFEISEEFLHAHFRGSRVPIELHRTVVR